MSGLSIFPLTLLPLLLLLSATQLLINPDSQPAAVAVAAAEAAAAPAAPTF